MSGTCTLKRPLSMRLTFGTNEGFTGGTAEFMANFTKGLDLCNCPKTPVVTHPYPSSNPNSVVTNAGVVLFCHVALRIPVRR
jgi:hypothetical protein